MLIDTIFISGLEVSTIIGVHAWEQHQPRPLIFDLELGVAITDAAASDQIRDTVDYKAVADAIVALAAERQFRLLETLAEQVARRLFAHFPIQRLSLTIGKPGALAEARNVGVRIERRREDYNSCSR